MGSIVTYTLEFDIAPDDLPSMNEQYTLAQSSRMLRRLDAVYNVMCFGGAVVLLAFAVIDLFSNPSGNPLVTILLAGVLVAVGAWRQSIGGTTGWLKWLTSAGIVEPARVEADDGAVRMQTPAISVDLEWEQVSRAFVTRDYIVIVPWSGKGVWVPQRVFPSSAELESFISFVETRAEAAHATQSPSLPNKRFQLTRHT
jgi:hypothetical protein